MHKINVLHIIVDHFNTLRAKNGRISLTEVALFFLLPAALALAAWHGGLKMSEGHLNFAVTTLAIFIGLLLNIQVLIFTSASRSSEPDERTQLMREVFANISFAILVFLACLALAACLLFVTDCVTFAVLQGLLVYFVISSFLTLLMILKRIHVILKTELR